MGRHFGEDSWILMLWGWCGGDEGADFGGGERGDCRESTEGAMSSNKGV